MRFINYIINEASFSSTGLERVVKLLIKVLSGRVGSQFYPFGNDNTESFTRSDGSKGIGMIYVLDDGKLVRFNWEKGIKSSTITSIDVWKDMKDLSKPFMTLEIPPNFNVVQAVSYIADFIKHPKVMDEIEESTKGIYGGKRKADSDKYGVPIDLPTAEFRRKVRAAKKAAGEPTTAKMRAKKGVKEKSTKQDDVEKAEKIFNKKDMADPDVVFEDLKELVRMVATGLQPSLVISGSSGIGKTFTATEIVSKVLGKEGGSWVLVKGKASPMGLYSSLFLNRDKLVVFDDIDSVLTDKDAILMMKAALDSYDKRVISWISSHTVNVSGLSKQQRKQFYDEVEFNFSTGKKDKDVKLPDSFEFTGRVIFITNLSQSKLDSAIKSRSFVIDVTLSANDIVKRMESILPNIMPEVDLAIKQEVMNFIKSEKSKFKDLNIRTLINSIKCRVSGSSRWQHLAMNYC